MSVSGTPDRPNPPKRIVDPLGISSIAAFAEGKTLFTSRRRLVEEKRRARRRFCNDQKSAWKFKSQFPQKKKHLVNGGAVSDYLRLRRAEDEPGSSN